MNDNITTSPGGIKIQRRTQVIERGDSKVICRLFMHGSNPSRVKRVIQNIANLSEQKTEELLDTVLDEFSDRHKNLEKILRQHFEQMHTYVSSIEHSFNEKQELLIGAYFTMEYAIESAALFNPSIVPHPDQSDVPEGCLRFIMSLRAVGEGHISSLVFRSGFINEKGEIKFKPISKYVTQPDLDNPVYEKHLFTNKLDVIKGNNKISDHILDQLSSQFTYDDLKREISTLSDEPRFPYDQQLKSFNHLHRLAESNYQLYFDPESDISERVIFPVSEEEQGGIEDARFVRFQQEDGETIYYATYTAFDGTDIMPQLIETEDFIHFRMRTLYGKAVQDKDMALFPRKINGYYTMLSRQDGVNNHIMFSKNLQFWSESEIIQKPLETWELVQIGNCGSPIETSEGWLVLTHGVGPIRTYSISAILLDLDDPTKVIGRLKQPLLKALEHQQIGYVPNVVYSCGAIVHNGQLIIPYSLSDVQPAIARLKLSDLLTALKKS